MKKKQLKKQLRKIVREEMERMFASKPSEKLVPTIKNGIISFQKAV